MQSARDAKIRTVGSTESLFVVHGRTVDETL